ncbi:MAG: Uma2 family endonuclease [Gemmataceae bacterium]
MIQNLQTPLENGEKLSREEFLRRWEAMPQTKFAELIGGFVYMPSPLSRTHGKFDHMISTWLGVYQGATPGCEGASNSTWLMLDDSPQPDNDLRILPEYGGKSRNSGKYPCGVPEFLAEICDSSASYDLHQKLDLYQQAGVDEYLAILVQEHEIRWHRLVNGLYETMPSPVDGVYRSIVFPGLWLNGKALLEDNLAQVLETLNEGIRSPEHAAFIARLAAQRVSRQ